MEHLVLLKDSLNSHLTKTNRQDEIRDICRQLQTITGTLQKLATANDAPARWDDKRHPFNISEKSVPMLQTYPFDTFGTNSYILQPPAETVTLCWQIFSKNIDPLIKVLHLPTTESILQKGVHKTHSLQNGEHTVLFGVYLAVISIMSPDAVQANFGISKLSALSTYKGALEHALLRSNVVATDDLIILQGFVLSLSLDRYADEARRVWALSALVERLTSSLRSTSSPLEKELRKRLVYELWYMDYRAYSDLGHISNPPSLNTLPFAPTNTNDADLHSNNPPHPISQTGWTDMSFSLTQAEVARTAILVDNIHHLDQKEAAIDACEQRVQSMYLAYCDGSKPIHWLAQHVAYVLVMELRFKAYSNPSIWAGPYTETRHSLFFAAIDILDIARRLAREPEAAQWIWSLEAYMQFCPLRFALQELCHGSRPKVLDASLGVVERAFRRWDSGKASKENYEICSQLLKRAKAMVRANRLRDREWNTELQMDHTANSQLDGISGGSHPRLLDELFPSEDGEDILSNGLFESSVDDGFNDAAQFGLLTNDGTMYDLEGLDTIVG